MMYAVEYVEKVVKNDILALPKSYKNRIKIAIESKLMVDPLTFGLPLRRSLKNYRKLRVGEYRVVFRIEDEIVKIFAIMHRSKVYNDVHKRI